MENFYVLYELILDHRSNPKKGKWKWQKWRKWLDKCSAKPEKYDPERQITGKSKS